MEAVHSIPLATPSSPLSVLLVNFFDPRHTLDTLAKSLGLTIEGRLDYIALPHVAAALDHAEAIIYRRAAHRATAAIEQVLSELQSLPSLPAAPTPSDTDRHRKHLEATRRAADLLRKSLPSPRAPHSAHPTPRVARTPHPTPIPRHDPRSTREHDSRRAQPPLEADDTLIEYPPRSSAPPGTLPPDHIATSSPPDHFATSPNNRSDQPRHSAPPCTLALDHSATSSLDHFATSSGTPYSRGQAG